MSITAGDSARQVSALNEGLDTNFQDIEEGLGGFLSVYIGDVYHNKYKVLNKIGYGLYSTVWLARDLEASLVYYLFSQVLSLWLTENV